jgi:hypothetical protein
MRKTRYKRPGRLGTGALLLFVLHVCCAQRTVWAGCSHLVCPSAGRFLVFGQMKFLIMQESSLSYPSGLKPLLTEPSPPERRALCTGRTCSSRDRSPTSTASPGADQFERWGTIAVSVDVDTLYSLDRLLDEPVRFAVGEKTSVFHPPRV